MSGRCWTHHAQDRAKERYGLHLVDHDFVAIMAEITSGTAPCMRLDEQGRPIHVVGYMGRSLVVALSADRGHITTFLPADFFTAGNRLARNKRLNRAKQIPSGQAARQEPYHRARFKRFDLEAE